MMFCISVLTTPAWADRNGISWGDLNQEEQQVMQPFAGRWDQLQPERQEHLRRGAERWLKMNPQEKEQARGIR